MHSKSQVGRWQEQVRRLREYGKEPHRERRVRPAALMNDSSRLHSVRSSIPEGEEPRIDAPTVSGVLLGHCQCGRKDGRYDTSCYQLKAPMKRALVLPMVGVALIAALVLGVGPSTAGK